MAAEQKHIEELKGKYLKKRVIGLSAKSQCSYIASMTKYYSARSREARRRAIAKALIVLKPIIMRLYWIVADKRHLRGIVAIQAAARDYVIRINIEYVVDLLIARKLHHLMATLIVRNWVRKYIVGYYEKFQARQFNSPIVRKGENLIASTSTYDTDKKTSPPMKPSASGAAKSTVVTPPRTKSPIKSQCNPGIMDGLSDSRGVLHRHSTGAVSANAALAPVESTDRSSTGHGGFSSNGKSLSEPDIGSDQPKRGIPRSSANTIANSSKQRRGDRNIPIIAPPKLQTVDTNPVPTYSQVAANRAKSPARNYPGVTILPVASNKESPPALGTRHTRVQPVPDQANKTQNHAVSFAPESSMLPSKAIVEEKTSTHNVIAEDHAKVGACSDKDKNLSEVTEVEPSNVVTPKKLDIALDSNGVQSLINSLAAQNSVPLRVTVTPVSRMEKCATNVGVSSPPVIVSKPPRSNAEKKCSIEDSSIQPQSVGTISSSGNMASAASSSTSSSVTTDSYALSRASFAHSRRGSRSEEEMLNAGRQLPEPLAASLGDAGRSELTPQQVQIVYRMFQLLRSGVPVIKHSRTSKPHLRTLYCDKEMKVLFWRQSGDSADADDGVPKKKSLFGRRSSFTRMDVEREIAFSDIIAIHTDFTSEVMQRSLAENYVTVDEGACIISIITGGPGGRTLDFELDEENFTPLLHSFQILVDFYSSILPQWNGRVGRADTLDFDLIDDNTNLLHHAGEW